MEGELELVSCTGDDLHALCGRSVGSIEMPKHKPGLVEVRWGRLRHLWREAPLPETRKAHWPAGLRVRVSGRGRGWVPSQPQPRPRLKNVDAVPNNPNTTDSPPSFISASMKRGAAILTASNSPTLLRSTVLSV